MSLQVFIALTTGVLSGLWLWAANSLELLVWAGFLGCTTYFASPSDGPKGLFLGFTTNMSGVFWAMVIISFSSSVNTNIASYLITAIVAFIMCIQAKQKLLLFIPGTFIGACATFASNGDWKVVSLSLTLGLMMGFLMKTTGTWLHKKLA